MNTERKCKKVTGNSLLFTVLIHVIVLYTVLPGIYLKTNIPITNGREYK